jgi:tryptophan synthase alpha chain
MQPMEPSERIRQRFEAARAAGRPALITYLTAGAPRPERTPSLALALERGGADILELGVPFSDPIADGPVIQEASDRALKAGTTMERVLEAAAEIRRRSEMPIVLFSYINPLMRYGFDRLCRDARAAGIDGVLITDLSVEEAEEPVEAMQRHGLDRIFLAAPTSTERRLDLVARYSSGFVYVVSRTGVTGARDTVSGGVEELVRRLRARTALPLAVGFGISARAHVEQVGRYADGAVVGSAVMRVVNDCADEGLEARLEKLCRELSGIA